MRCECARPRALSSSLSPVELVTTKTVVEQICEKDLQNTVPTDFRVEMTECTYLPTYLEMTVFDVMPLALFRYYLAS